MSCQSCKSERIADITAKCSDCFRLTLNYINHEEDGYVNDEIGIGGGDYINMSYCLNCGQIQGEFPLPYSGVEIDALEEEFGDLDKELKYYYQHNICDDLVAAGQGDILCNNELTHYRITALRNAGLISLNFQKFMSDFYLYNLDNSYCKENKEKFLVPTEEEFIKMVKEDRPWLIEY